jgi:hypothetical protein
VQRHASLPTAVLALLVLVSIPRLQLARDKPGIIGDVAMLPSNTILVDAATICAATTILPTGIAGQFSSRESFGPRGTTDRFQPMASHYEAKCRELAGHVLAHERGLNSPAHRIELAALIERAIEDFIAFEKGKSRYT